MRRCGRSGFGDLLAALALAGAALRLLSPSCLAAETTEPASLDRGYQMMYNLDFSSAARFFATWQASRPGDPLGPISEAANILFSELDRLGVLEAQFLVNDEEFLARPEVFPDREARARLVAALARGESRALERLRTTPRDADALFALTLVHGLRADHAALVENRNLAALKETRRASQWAKKLLAVAPGREDAYLATGIGKYLVGSTVAPVRWILRLAGYEGDKEQGIRELERAAEGGRYLAPFARLLLAIAYLREDDPARARQLLVGLGEEFPANPLYAREISRIDARRK